MKEVKGQMGELDDSGTRIGAPQVRKEDRSMEGQAHKMGWMICRLDWQAHNMGWMFCMLDSQAHKMGWMGRLVVWKAHKMGWQVCLVGWHVCLVGSLARNYRLGLLLVYNMGCCLK